MLKEIEKINNSNFNEFLNNRINLTNELQEKFNRKFGVSNEIKVISKDCKHLINTIESDKKSIEISISNSITKYCYKADNFYDFERRVYLLSKLMKKKELIVHESKKA